MSYFIKQSPSFPPPQVFSSMNGAFSMLWWFPCSGPDIAVTTDEDVRFDFVPRPGTCRRPGIVSFCSLPDAPVLFATIRTRRHWIVRSVSFLAEHANHRKANTPESRTCPFSELVINPILLYENAVPFCRDWCRDSCNRRLKNFRGEWNRKSDGGNSCQDSIRI